MKTDVKYPVRPKNVSSRPRVGNRTIVADEKEGWLTRHGLAETKR